MPENDKKEKGKNIPEIKICGLTRLEEADYVAEADVDYAGFVMYYPKSKRNVYPHTVLPIKERLKQLNPEIKTVAVTVSPGLEQLEAVERMEFDFIQIHGELREEVLKAASIPIFRAYNIADKIVTEHLMQEEKISGVVFDGKIPGNGEAFDWSLLSDFKRNGKKLMLAGGLNEENVSRAICEALPDIVDVSSGVETVYSSLWEKDGGCMKRGGRKVDFCGKDREKIKAFVTAVRRTK